MKEHGHRLRWKTSKRSKTNALEARMLRFFLFSGNSPEIFSWGGTFTAILLLPSTLSQKEKRKKENFNPNLQIL